MKAPIKGAWTSCMVFNNVHHLNLYQTLYIPLVSRNLISISEPDIARLSLKIGNGCFSLFKDPH